MRIARKLAMRVLYLDEPAPRDRCGAACSSSEGPAGSVVRLREREKKVAPIASAVSCELLGVPDNVLRGSPSLPKRLTGRNAFGAFGERMLFPSSLGVLTSSHRRCACHRSLQMSPHGAFIQ